MGRRRSRKKRQASKLPSAGSDDDDDYDDTNAGLTGPAELLDEGEPGSDEVIRQATSGKQKAPRKKKPSTFRSDEVSRAKSRKSNAQNHQGPRWTRHEIEILVESRKTMGWAEMARQHPTLAARGRKSCNSKFYNLKKDANGEPIIPDENEFDEDITLPASSKTQAVDQMEARIARIFINCPRAFRGDAPTMQTMVHSDFAEYREVLQDWRASAEYKEVSKLQDSPLPLSVLSPLSWNDHLSQSDEAVGRFRNDWGTAKQALVYLSDRAWTPTEQAEYRSVVPWKRLHWNGLYLHWHWKDPRTLVLPILIHASENDSDGDEVFRMSLTDTQWADALAGKDAGPLLLLVSKDNVIFTSLQELAQCYEEGDPEFGTARTLPSGKKDGGVRVDWWLASGRNSLWWKDDRMLAIDDDQLQDKIIKRLLKSHRRLRDSKRQANGLQLLEWGDVYEGLMGGE